ncbi:MAG: PAS domain S-box protein [Candidatus Saliniplasma sp.]
MRNNLNDEIYKKINESGVLDGSVKKEDIIKEVCKLIFKHSYDMISILDEDSKPIFVNKAHKRILGYDEDFLLNKTAFDFFHPEDLESIKDEWSKLIERKEDRKELVLRFKAEDGSYIWLETHLKTLTNEGGDVVSILCISRDITDKVKVEEKLKRNKEKVERLHDVAHDLDTCRTEDEVFDVCMKAAKKILNFDYISTFKKAKEGFEAKAISYEIEPKLKGNIYDKDNYTWQTYITGKSFLVKDIEEDERAEAGLTEYKSGLSIPIGEYGVFQALSEEKNRYDKDDLELSELLVSHINQALERIRYRKKLKESEERYRYIFENTGTATIILEEDTTIALINEKCEKLIGYSKEEIEGKMSFKDFLVKEEVEKLRRYHHVRRHDQESIPSYYETKIVTKFGDPRNVLVSVGLMPNSNRSIVSILDITKSRRNFKALSESEEAFRIAFDRSFIPMIRVDRELNILDVNREACDLLNRSEEKLLNINFKKILYGNDKDVIRKFDKVIKGGSATFELDFNIGADPVEVEVRADPITDVDGQTKFILIQLR